MSAVSESVKVGDKVRVGAGMRVRSLEKRQGEMLTVTDVANDTAFWATDTEGETYALYTSEVELVTDAQTIEVGDTVKATHPDGTTVQGVAEYAEEGNVDITLPGSSGAASMYENEGWTFEVVSKVVKPVRVGDVVKDAESLPVGTVTVEYDGSGPYLLTLDGWTSRTGTTYPARNYGNGTTIVFLPESAND